MPSSSIREEILSIPVSRRRLQTSGGSLGMAFPRAIRINDRIIEGVTLSGIEGILEKEFRDIK